MTSKRFDSLYSLMDAGYASRDISNFVKSKGKVSIIAPKKPKNGELVPLDPPKALRFKNRIVVERANARIKDDLASSRFSVQGVFKGKLPPWFFRSCSCSRTNCSPLNLNAYLLSSTCLVFRF